MPLGEFGVELKSFQSRISRFCHGIALRHGKIKWKQNVTISQTGIGERGLRIVCDCLLVEGDRLRQIVAGTFFPKRFAFLVKLGAVSLVRCGAISAFSEPVNFACSVSAIVFAISLSTAKMSVK